MKREKIYGVRCARHPKFGVRLYKINGGALAPIEIPAEKVRKRNMCCDVLMSQPGWHTSDAIHALYEGEIFML